MRDRGITRPGLKAAIAAALAIAGAVAAIWGAQNLTLSPDQASATRVARNLGVIALVVGGLATANYLYALFLVRRMRLGEGVIGRWIVTPATFARFRDAERAQSKRKNNWRIPRDEWPEGLPVIFSSDAVLVGDSWFADRIGKTVARRQDGLEEIEDRLRAHRVAETLRRRTQS